MSRNRMGTIYLLHFDEPVSNHARHYLGWASDLEGRLDAHRRGHGARLMEVVKERGIGWHVARTWEGTRDRERALKDRAEGPKLCPDCTPSPRPAARGRSAPPPAPEPTPDPGPSGVWPGQALESASHGYPELWDVTDTLTGKWRAEADAALAAVPAPRAPDPEIEAPEPEMEIEL
jgi:predicted GIY-YIG superfamily endonuclease